MPSLFRFLTVIGVIGAVVYGILYALATFVEPQPREITVTLPQQRLKPGPAPGPESAPQP